MVKVSPQLLPQHYLSLADQPVAGDGYSALPVELLTVEKMLSSDDIATAQWLNKTLCRTLLENFSLTDLHWALPAVFNNLYQFQLERIEQNLKSKPDAYFSLANDLFRKDLAILRFRLIPCGAEFFTPFSGIARSLMWRDGLPQAGRFFAVVARCGGIRPFLELHMHPEVIDDFNPDGWLATYDNLADFLTLNSSFRGVQSTSWFLDPELAKISPHLSYLRDIPARCGAAILYGGEDDPNSSGAFRTSQSRRTLHAAGRYSPQLYTRIWPRQALLQRLWR